MPPHLNPRQTFTPRPLHHALTIALLSLALNAHAEVQSADRTALDTPHRYQLPAASLGRTLAAFAVQAGLALSFDPAMTDGLSSQGLNGTYTPRQALERLLAASGLEAVTRGDGSFTLRRKPASTNSAEATLAPVSVRAGTSQRARWHGTRKRLGAGHGSRRKTQRHRNQD